VKTLGENYVGVEDYHAWGNETTVCLLSMDSIESTGKCPPWSKATRWYSYISLKLAIVQYSRGFVSALSLPDIRRSKMNGGPCELSSPDPDPSQAMELGV
jgi:hypothetical protein